MRYGSCFLALACGVAMGGGSPRHVAAQARERVPTGTIVARAADYVAAYQQAFAFLVADELYVQQAIRPRGSGDERDSPPVGRTMRGEMFLTYLPADRRWVALHDVAEVDGQPVREREDLRALLAASSVQSVAGRLFRHNARYNIGSISRNFNEPTLALQVLDPLNQPRFDFRVEPAAPAEAGLTVIRFRERGRPTLVRSLDGKPVFSTGELVVEAATGAVHRSRIAFRHQAIDAELVTAFDFEKRLALWLPSRFSERYATGPRDGQPEETITGEATYTNYRRFEGRVRVVTGDR